MSRLRMIVTDLDGTLLSEHGKPTNRNIKAFKLLSDAGVPIVIASGRSLSAMALTKAVLGFHLPMIGFNGSVVVSEHEKLISFKPVEKPLAARVVEFARSQGHVTNWYLGPSKSDATGDNDIDIQSMGVAAYCEKDGHIDLTKRYTNLTGMEYQLLQDAYEELIEIAHLSPPAKLLVLTGDEDSEAFYKLALEKFSPEEVHIIKDKWFVEFIAPEVHKASALTSLLVSVWNNDKSVALDEICAFGDGPNDVELLKSVGCGIAMGNAVPACKESSAFVSEHTNNEDAVARELHRLVSEGRFYDVSGSQINRNLLVTVLNE